MPPFKTKLLHLIVKSARLVNKKFEISEKASNSLITQMMGDYTDMQYVERKDMQ